MKTIRIWPIRGTTLAENKDEAATIRERDILPSLGEGKPVAIDFAEIQTVTQSYMHALIAGAVRRHGDDAFRLLVFRNCNDGVQHIVRTVFEYTLRAKQELEERNGIGDAAAT